VATADRDDIYLPRRIAGEAMCQTGVFEIVMLLCFSAAWPFSIARSLKSKSTQGKSFLFTAVVFVGYVAGIIHKVNCTFDPIVSLYIFNAVLVLADMALYLRNYSLEKRMPA